MLLLLLIHFFLLFFDFVAAAAVESVERVQHKSLQLRCIHEHIDIHINTVANKVGVMRMGKKRR